MNLIILSCGLLTSAPCEASIGSSIVFHIHVHLEWTLLDLEEHMTISIFEHKLVQKQKYAEALLKLLPLSFEFIDHEISYCIHAFITHTTFIAIVVAIGLKKHASICHINLFYLTPYKGLSFPSPLLTLHTPPHYAYGSFNVFKCPRPFRLLMCISVIHAEIVSPISGLFDLPPFIQHHHSH